MSNFSRPSNHPPFALKQIMKSVSERTSPYSCNKQVFNVAASICNILAKRGYSEKMFEETDSTKEKNNRRKNMLWYKPPAEVKINNVIPEQPRKICFSTSDKKFDQIS